jgi:hypothetical protein
MNDNNHTIINLFVEPKVEEEPKVEVEPKVEPKVEVEYKVEQKKVSRKRSFSEIDNDNDGEEISIIDDNIIITEPPRKKRKRTLGKLPTIEQLRTALRRVYTDMGPRLSESHYQGGLHVFLEKHFNLKVTKEYPLKFILYGGHLGYKKHGYYNHINTKDDGKFYNYLDLHVEGSNGVIIIECKINESYKLSFKPNLKSFLGKYKPSEKTFDQIQRYHVLLEENNIQYKAFYLMNFPSKKRSKIPNYYVKHVKKNKKNFLYDD